MSVPNGIQIYVHRTGIYTCTTSVRKDGIAVPSSVSETSVKVPEHRRKQQLGAHPGLHMEPGPALGLERVQAGLRRLLTLQHQEQSLRHTLKVDIITIYVNTGVFVVLGPEAGCQTTYATQLKYEA